MNKSASSHFLKKELKALAIKRSSVVLDEQKDFEEVEASKIKVKKQAIKVKEKGNKKIK